MTNVKTLGVLGCGSIGLRHVQNAIDLGCRVLVFDPSQDRMAAAVSRGAVAAPSRSELLKHCDALLIATPSALHRADLIDSLAIGRHVLVEKPFVTEISRELTYWINDAQQRGVVVAASMNMRFNPCVQAARALLETGTLKTPVWGHFVAASYLPGWRPGQDYRQGYAANAATGGAIFDFTHEIDLAWHLLGAARLQAAFPRQSGHLELASEDVADIVLNHQSGCRTTVHVDYLTRPRRRGFEIAFTDGFLAADLEKGTIRAWDASGREILNASHPAAHNETYVGVLKAFLARVASGSGTVCTAADALAVSRLAIDARSMQPS